MSRFQRALRYEDDAGDDSIIVILTEEFGDKDTARTALRYLGEAARISESQHRIIRWVWFGAGVAVTLAFALAVRVFT